MTKSTVKKPSLDGLRKATKILKEIHDKEPSDELLDIISEISGEEEFEDSDDKVAAKSYSNDSVEASL